MLPAEMLAYSVFRVVASAQKRPRFYIFDNRDETLVCTCYDPVVAFQIFHKLTGCDSMTPAEAETEVRS